VLETTTTTRERKKSLLVRCNGGITFWRGREISLTDRFIGEEGGGPGKMASGTSSKRECAKRLKSGRGKKALQAKGEHTSFFQH